MVPLINLRLTFSIPRGKSKESIQRNKTQPWRSSDRRSYRSRPSRWPRVCTLKRSPSRSRPEWPGDLLTQLRIALWIRKKKRESVVKRGGSFQQKQLTPNTRDFYGVEEWEVLDSFVVPPSFVVFAVYHNRTSACHSAGSLFVWSPPLIR